MNILIIAGGSNFLSAKRDLSSFDKIINAFPADSSLDGFVSNRCDIWSFSPHILKGFPKWVICGKRWMKTQFCRRLAKRNPRVNPFVVIPNPDPTRL